MKNVLKSLQDTLKFNKDCLANVERIKDKGHMTKENYERYLNLYLPLIAEFEEAIDVLTKHLKNDNN